MPAWGVGFRLRSLHAHGCRVPGKGAPSRRRQQPLGTAQGCPKRHGQPAVGTSAAA